MFGRPKNGQPTRHLFVGNCGPSVGIDRDTLTQLFSKFGSATVTVPEQKQNPRSAFVFVTYASSDEAAAALSQLDDKPCSDADGRCFSIKYADLKKEQVGQPLQPNCKLRGLCLTIWQCAPFRRKRLNSLWRSQQTTAQLRA